MENDKQAPQKVGDTEEYYHSPRVATINHVVYVNGQPVFSCDNTDRLAEVKCEAVMMDHFNKCLAAGGKSDVKHKANKIPKEKSDAA